MYDSAAKVDDKAGHGTAMAAIIAGNPNNGGIIGVVPQATIYPFVDLNPDGSSNILWLRKVLEYILNNESNYDIVNMSLNVVKSEYDEIASFIQKLNEKGIILTAAAGNGKSIAYRIFYPAFSDFIISVGAIQDDHLAFFKTNGFYDKVDYFFRNDALPAPTINPADTERITGCSIYTAVLTGLIASVLSEKNIPRANRKKIINDKLSQLSFDYRLINTMETLTLYKI